MPVVFIYRWSLHTGDLYIQVPCIQVTFVTGNLYIEGVNIQVVFIYVFHKYRFFSFELKVLLHGKYLHIVLKISLVIYLNQILIISIVAMVTGDMELPDVPTHSPYSPPGVAVASTATRGQSPGFQSRSPVSQISGGRAGASSKPGIEWNSSPPKRTFVRTDLPAEENLFGISS